LAGLFQLIAKRRIEEWRRHVGRSLLTQSRLGCEG
jgi:hypothetical protein